MLGKRSESEYADACRRGRHVVRMERLHFQSPAHSDVRAMLASASDAEAQRWLGWPKGLVIREPRRGSLLAKKPGQGRMRAAGMMGDCYLIAIDQATGLLAGGVGYDPQNGELGGWLTPELRGRGLGAALFAAAAQFVHYHLGEEYVLAGTERANVPCVRALLSAGFTPVSGPDTHRLPDGRVVPACWFQHAADQPVECG